jgi:iron complex outermembrane receptor protein
MLTSGSLISYAQDGAQIAGRITDPQGLEVSGADVALYARSGGTRLAATTDAAGMYRFDRLPAGEYLVQAEAKGFSPTAATAVRVDGAGESRIDISLQLAGVRDTVVVTASGTPQFSDEISKVITVVDDRDLEQRNEFALAEALRQTPGLRIQQLGGPGAFTSIKTRGLRNEDTAVLIDGLRFREASAPQGDASGFLGDMIITDVDRLEVLRGSGSSLYGTHAIGGVVNVITDQGGGRTRGSVLAEGGALGMFRGRARLAGGLNDDRVDYSMGMAHLNVADGIDSDDTARNTSGQGQVGFRLSPSTRLSARIYAGDTFLQLNSSAQTLGGMPASGIVDAIPLSLAELSRHEDGIPATELNQGGATFIPAANDPDAHRKGHFFTGALILSGRPAEALGYTLSYQGLNTFRSFRDGPLGVGFQPTDRTRADSTGVIHTVDARANVLLGRANLLDAGYQFESETYRNRSFPGDPASNSTVDVTQRSNALFVQDQLRLFDNRLHISAAFRTQFFSLLAPVFTPSASAPYAGISFDAPPTSYTGDGSIAYFFRASGTKIRAHVGNGYRAPSLFERFGSDFGGFGYFTYGDPRLRPDRSIAFDGGLDQAFWGNRIRTSATYFYTRLQERIAFDFTGAIDPATDPFGRFGGYRNTRGGLARGLELSASTAATRNLDVTAAYTYTNADERAPIAAGIIRSFAIPNHQFSFQVTQRFGSRVFVNLDAAFSSSYLAPIFDSATFATRAFEFSGMAKADLVTSYRLPVSDSKAIRFYAKVQNLFDRDYYENGFRTPGAGGIGGLQFEF